MIRKPAAAALLPATPLLFAALFLCAALSAQAQSFGFGASGDAESESTASTPAASLLPSSSGPSIAGDIRVSGMSFPIAPALDPTLDAFAANIAGFVELGAAGSGAEAVFRIRLDPALLAVEPGSLVDEARLRLFLGDVTADAGLLRTVWGRADSLSVLDVVNTHDRRNLAERDDRVSRRAAPTLKASWAIGPRANLEAVFLPWLLPERLATTGHWAPKMFALVASKLPAGTPLLNEPDTRRIEYWQSGARFSGGAGSVDFAVQYFYGYLPTPMFHIEPSAIPTWATTIPVSWTRFHQVGADAAFELGGFNVRVESGLNLTSDLDGTDKTVYNPSFVWAAGFDRPLPAGIDLNLQAKGSARFFDSAARASGGIESAMDATDTQAALRLARDFARGAVTAEFLAVAGIERRDFMLSPGLTIRPGDAEIALRGALFLPTDLTNPGNLGQYGDRSYLELAASWKF